METARPRTRRSTTSRFSLSRLRPNHRGPQTQVAAYLAADPPDELEGQLVAFAARPPLKRASGDDQRASSSPRRYTGRSSRRPAEPRTITQPHKTHSSPLQFPATEETPRARIQVPSLPWSGRLTLALSAVVLALLGLRLLGLFVPPLDAPAGSQATHAVYVRALSSQVATVADSGLLGEPWLGVAPVNPLAGVPVFDWLAAGLARLGATGEWPGRGIALLFSLVAGCALFGVVRRAAGSLAAIYAMLFYAIAPLSVTLGGQYSPSSLILAAQGLAMLALLNWHASVQPDSGGGARGKFALALASAAVASLLDPGSLFLALPASYLILSADAKALQSRLKVRRAGAALGTWGDAWEHSSHRGKVAAYAVCMAVAAGGWWLYSSRADGLVLGAGDGAGGAGAFVGNLLSWGTYTQLVGVTIGKLLLVVGLMLLGAGLLNGARQGTRGLFNVWLLAGLLHALFDAGRLARHEDVLLPLILPACALVGIGASWAGSLPSRVWQALGEQPKDSRSEYAVSPHTAWLLDLPEVRAVPAVVRPQARPALSKSLASRSSLSDRNARRMWMMALGHLAVLAALSLVGLSGWQAANAAAQPSAESVQLAQAGQEIASLTQPGDKLLVVGPHAPELFYASNRTGWVLDEDSFGIVPVQELQRQGAQYLLTTDQEWLGRHPDYRGLLANYSVKKLSQSYILFDLNSKPTENDVQYFLQSGHTLGGDFRKFWEASGGVARLGYPISEQVVETNPLDGQQRTVQYFERAVLELHPEYAGTKDVIMLAAVGRWVTLGRDFPRVAQFQNTADKWYFPQTGHSVKQAFLRYWQTQGGLAAFGYPISEEMPEISPADGKVYTVQYFERARFEWHPAFAGTPQEVQLGLVGKQALEMHR